MWEENKGHWLWVGDIGFGKGKGTEAGVGAIGEGARGRGRWEWRGGGDKRGIRGRGPAETFSFKSSF